MRTWEAIRLLQAVTACYLLALLFNLGLPLGHMSDGVPGATGSGRQGVGAIGEAVPPSHPQGRGISGDESSHVSQGSVAQWPGEDVVDQLLGKCVSAAEGIRERIRSAAVKEICGVGAFGECCRSR